MAKHETSTSYRWPEGSVIKRVDIRQQKNGFAVAYLYADDREEQRNARSNIRAAIRLKGWGTLSDSRDGAFVLRVAGLRNGDELISMLQAQGFVSTPATTETKDVVDKEAPKTLTQNVRANSLRFSGIIATIGNALSISSGIHRSQVAGSKDWGQMGKGLFFAAADLPLMIAGGRDDSRQLNSLLKELKQTYIKEGIQIPSTASVNVETSDKGKSMGERSMDLMHRYANQIKCSMEVLAAGMGIWAGKKQRSKFKEMSPYFWGSGFLASLLIPERKIDPEQYEKAGTIGRAWMKVQSNPLAIGGMLGYTNNIGDYLSASAEKREWLAAGAKGPKLYNWDRVTPTVMLGANGLYAASKKTVGGDIKNDAMVQDAYRIASQIINKQPDGALREKAVETTARFFAQRIEIKGNYHEIRARLTQELDSQRQNPWFELQGLAPYIPTPKRQHLDDSQHAVAIAAAAMPSPKLMAGETTHVAKGMRATNDEQLVETSNSR